MTRSDNVRQLTMVAVGSLGIALLVLVLKYVAYRMTGSLALYSDALESIVNVATAVAALVALRLTFRPANENLPYGYYKAEYFSAVLVGVLIVVAAVLIFRDVYQAFWEPVQVKMSGLALGVNALAGVINAIWSWVLVTYGTRWRSPALVADGKHLRLDVISSVGVLAGVGLAMVTGWQQLDLLLAALVGVNILWNGWQVVKESVGGLMDVAVPEDMLRDIKALIAAHGEGALEAHDIRTRQAGRVVFVDFHLVVPATMTVREAHDICDSIEEKLKQAVRDIIVNIHVEPEEKAKRTGLPIV